MEVDGIPTRARMSVMEFVLDVLCCLAEEALLELGLRALFLLPGFVAGLGADSVQTLFSRHRLD